MMKSEGQVASGWEERRHGKQPVSSSSLNAFLFAELIIGRGDRVRAPGRERFVLLEVQIVRYGNPVPRLDFCDFVFGVAVECDVCDSRLFGPQRSLSQNRTSILFHPFEVTARRLREPSERR